MTIPSPVLKVASSAAEMYFVPTLLEDVERRELRLKARAAVLAALDSLGGEAAREALLERALADGGFTPRELAAGPPEAAAASYHSVVAHQLSWALTNLKRDGLVDNPRRAVWRLAGAALETVPLAVEAETGPDRLVELRTMPYREYLRTPEWRRARAAALLRAGHCCSLDVTHTQNLEVHHRTYERRGAELASDLVVLCESCHRLHHKEHGRPGGPARHLTAGCNQSRHHRHPRLRGPGSPSCNACSLADAHSTRERSLSLSPRPGAARGNPRTRRACRAGDR